MASVGVYETAAKRGRGRAATEASVNAAGEVSKQNQIPWPTNRGSPGTTSGTHTLVWSAWNMT